MCFTLLPTEHFDGDGVDNDAPDEEDAHFAPGAEDTQSFVGNFVHGVVEGSKGEDVADGLHPFGKDGGGKEGAGKQELGENEDVGINRYHAFGAGNAANGEAKAHKDDAGEEGQQKHVGKGGDTVDEGEAKEEIAKEHDDDDGK